MIQKILLDSDHLGWVVVNLYIFTGILGEMIQFDLNIFFNWVGEENHQLRIYRYTTFFQISTMVFIYIYLKYIMFIIYI